MFKQSTVNQLSLAVGTLFLTYLAGIKDSVAADMGTDTQIQAAHLLQHPQTWSTSTDGFKQSGFSSDKVSDPQKQAQRVLLSVYSISIGGPESIPGQFLSSESAEPQLRAARVLSRNFY